MPPTAAERQLDAVKRRCTRAVHHARPRRPVLPMAPVHPAPASAARGDLRRAPAGSVRPMARLRVHNFTLSLDGYAAGPNQGVEQPLGENGLQLHDWIFQTASMRSMLGQDGGDTCTLPSRRSSWAPASGCSMILSRSWPGTRAHGWTAGAEWRTRTSRAGDAPGASHVPLSVAAVSWQCDTVGDDAAASGIDGRATQTGPFGASPGPPGEALRPAHTRQGAPSRRNSCRATVPIRTERGRRWSRSSGRQRAVSAGRRHRSPGLRTGASPGPVRKRR